MRVVAPCRLAGAAAVPAPEPDKLHPFETS